MVVHELAIPLLLNVKSLTVEAGQWDMQLPYVHVGLTSNLGALTFNPRF
jgi:hypothetical protein